ncbi:hypothetical protein HGO53_01720 [Wolbachia endosymbiont of Diaphorina citri]|jgi:hypothetical protein|uniref:hypothetical protein n=1 Tax=Wolbachia endosymbiont of Diaphorina citri TaxID=116598 RepID=UPI0002F9C892|nr:hypothetical protein [Wolbachia endosymbiont of Diaphorina citri]QJT94067.1 hypothetical protein HGO48_01010 [Wolbachia endosymbiont of Diaphorina citri]QJT95308.1 hypothetical protein HGO49_01010 [Wolbachia endosymbiont of Diaphorina citri]QJT96670.1 hypothetical protein HGO53_01720 [Wolbachia endosymbiont of Diaphorina citri]QLK10966.1 hypothetical protein FK497_01050 [Wolbachia endosymbiont of Diaphorina citri]QXY87501.1 hypothetical protein GZ064_06745 [Wolbachia endosymbiont of Diaphor
MGGSNEKVDYTELSKSSISDKIKPKKKVTFCQQVQVKEIPLEGKKGACKRYKEKKEKQKHKLNKKPQLWERGAAIIVPPVIGLLGGLITLTLITEEPFLIAALAAIAITAAIYELEYLLKPELLEKPGKTLKDLVTDSFVKEEKNSRTVSQ